MNSSFTSSAVPALKYITGDREPVPDVLGPLSYRPGTMSPEPGPGVVPKPASPVSDASSLDAPVAVSLRSLLSSCR